MDVISIRDYEMRRQVFIVNKGYHEKREWLSVVSRDGRTFSMTEAWTVLRKKTVS